MRGFYTYTEEAIPLKDLIHTMEMPVEAIHAFKGLHFNVYVPKDVYVYVNMDKLTFKYLLEPLPPDAPYVQGTYVDYKIRKELLGEPLPDIGSDFTHISSLTRRIF